MDKKKTLFILNILSAGVFIIILLVYVLDLALLDLDLWFNESMVSLEASGLTIFFKLITSFGNEIPMIVVSLIVFVGLLVMKKWKRSIIFAAGMLSGWGGYLLVKSAMLRPRPGNHIIVESQYALPSGHATMAVLLYGFLIYAFSGMFKNRIARKAFMIICLAMPALIGFSRLYLRVHWPSDVIAGYAFGAFILTSLILFFGKIEA